MSENKKIAARVGVVGFFTFLSRITGLLRDMAIANAFGTKMVADAFFVAFRIPNLLRRLFAEGALTVSFVPVFTQTLKKSREEAKRVVSVAFTLTAVLLTFVSLLGILLSHWLVKFTAWGFSHDAEKFALTVLLNRIMFPYILLVSLAALAMGTLNSLKHFAAPAASSIFMNLSIIVGAFYFIHWFNLPVLGLTVGVLLGGLLQLLVQLPFLKKYGFFPKITWDPKHPAVKRIVGMMLPAAYGAAVYQFNVIMITFLASFLPSGSVSYLWYADRVTEFPLGIFAVSLATVVLPSLSDHAADKNMTALKETFAFGLRLIFFITLPAAAGLICLSGPIIKILFQHGTFSAASTGATSAALACFALGIPFVAGVRITSNAFYSMQDSKTPVRVANMAVLVNLVLALILMWPLKHRGLALALALSSVFNFTMHIVDFRKKVGRLGLKKIAKGLIKSVTATAAMSAFLLWARTYFVGAGAWKQIENLVILISGGALIYFGVCFLLKSDEMKGLKSLIRRKKVSKTPPPTDLL